MRRLDGYSLRLELMQADMAELVELIEQAWDHELAPVDGFKLTIDTKKGPRKGGFERVLAIIRKPDYDLENAWVELLSTKLFRVVISYSPGDQIFSVGVTANGESLDLGDLVRIQRMLLEIMRGVFRSPVRIVDASLYVWEGPTAMPSPPRIKYDFLAVVISEDAIRENYSDPEAFLQVDWGRRERNGDLWLLERAEGCVHTHEFFETVNPLQRELARIAKPCRTKYPYGDIFDKEVEKIYRSGKRLMRIANYLAEEQQLIMSALPEDGEHIPGWEIDTLFSVIVRGWAKSKEQPVKEVRVIFLDKETAEREKRPPMDIGAKVGYLQDG